MSIKLLGYLLCFVVYSIVFNNFEDLFGKTPVNLLGISNHYPGWNLLVNSVSYAIISFVICAAVGVFFKNRVAWFKGVAISALFMSIIFYFLVPIMVYWYYIRDLE